MLSPGRNNLEIFAVISSDGILKICDNVSGIYEVAYIVNKNILNNMVEKINMKVLAVILQVWL